MKINRLSSIILFTIASLSFVTPPSSAQDILATKRGIVKLMKAVHEREMVVYGSIRWLYTYGSLEWVYNSTTTWTRYTTDGTIPATTKDPPLDWLDGEYVTRLASFYREDNRTSWQWSGNKCWTLACHWSRTFIVGNNRPI